MANITSNGINLYYEAHGEGVPLLLIQGTFDSSGWACQVPALSERYRVITYDHRGLGRSDAPEGPYTVDELAKDAIGLLDGLGMEKAHVVGYSLGGCVAMQMAVKRPGMVRGLVLAGTYNGIPALGRYRTQSWIEMLKEDGRLDRVLREFLPWVFSETFFENKENPAAFLKAMDESPFPMKPHGILGLADAIVSYTGIKDLPAIKSPVLVIAGSEDLAAPVREGRKLAQGIPGARLEILDAAHLFIIEDAERFNAAVIDFLAGL